MRFDANSFATFDDHAAGAGGVMHFAATVANRAGKILGDAGETSRYILSAVAVNLERIRSVRQGAGLAGALHRIQELPVDQGAMRRIADLMLLEQITDRAVEVKEHPMHLRVKASGRVEHIVEAFERHDRKLACGMVHDIADALNFFPEGAFVLELTWEGTLEFGGPTFTGPVQLHPPFASVITAQMQTHRRIERLEFGTHVQPRVQLIEQTSRLEASGDGRADGKTECSNFGFARVSGGATARMNVTLENPNFQAFIGEQCGGGQASETRANHGRIGVKVLTLNRGGAWFCGYGVHVANLAIRPSRAIAESEPRYSPPNSRAISGRSLKALPP